MASARNPYLFLLLALAICAGPTRSQTEADFQGRWEGTLAGKLRLVVELQRATDGLWFGRLTSVDQGNVSFALDDIRVDEGAISFAVREVRGAYEGKFDDARNVLTGTWVQGMPQPLQLRKGASSSANAPPPAASSAPPQAWPFGMPIVIDVPVPPTAVPGGGRSHLAYELHVTNFSGAPIELRRLEAWDADGPASSQPLLRLEGNALISALQPVGVRAPPGVADLRNLTGGSRVVAYVWVSLDAAASLPRRLRHRIATSAREFDAGTIALRAVKPPSLGPPLKGSGWVAGNGPDNASGHRRALIPVDGRATIAQRFAIDWVKIGPDGRTFRGKAQENRSYHAYGSELLAVADGEIVAVHDGIPENVPGPESRAVPITLETVAGNYVMLALGDDQFAVYAHLQPGTLRVKAGDVVKRGQVLGLLGNSGNSTEPHLHFHVCNGPTALTSEGIPYVHDAFDLYDSSGKSVPKRRELPLLNAVVGFE